MGTGSRLGVRLGASTFVIVCMLMPAAEVAAECDESGFSDCVYECIFKIRSLPESDFLLTLDGRRIWLADVFDECQLKWPWCCLFGKFYHWHSDIKFIVSKSSRGYVKHKIRIYHNCLTVCHPDRVDARKTHGDVAEFYNADGAFMGLAVYMGNGQYCPLCCSGRENSSKNRR